MRSAFRPAGRGHSIGWLEGDSRENPLSPKGVAWRLLMKDMIYFSKHNDIKGVLIRGGLGPAGCTPDSGCTCVNSPRMSHTAQSDHQLLEAMIDASIDAGHAVQEIYRNASPSSLAVRSKADASPVTRADHVSEAIILERLARCAAGTPVVAEEEVAAGRVPTTGDEFFLVDPLDGTKEFIARRGEFTINIALIRNRMPALGVVYAPASGRLYAADAPARLAFRIAPEESAEPQEPGRETHARQPIHIRSAPTQGITVVSSRSHPSPQTEAYLAAYAIAERISIGSSLKFCLVAEGLADLYPRLGPTMEWDTAAGHAVVLGAGGSVVTSGGQPLRYGKTQYRNPWFVASGTLTPRRIED